MFQTCDLSIYQDADKLQTEYKRLVLSEIKRKEERLATKKEADEAKEASKTLNNIIYVTMSNYRKLRHSKKISNE